LTVSGLGVQPTALPSSADFSLEKHDLFSLHLDTPIHVRKGEGRDSMRLLDTISARSIILLASVLVVSAMKLPLVVAVAVILAIQAGLIWYHFSSR
jgi:hypothetical protein